MSRANLGPLTMVYTPPASCFTPWVRAYHNYYIANYGQICWTGEGPSYYVAELCYPLLLGSTHNQQVNVIPIFSPGFSCPSGFTPACTVTRGASETSPLSTGTDYTVQWSILDPGETAVNCCPRWV